MGVHWYRYWWSSLSCHDWLNLDPLTCALPFPFLFRPVRHPLAAGGSGAMRRCSISFRNIFLRTCAQCVATFTSKESPSLLAVWYNDVNPWENMALQSGFGGDSPRISRQDLGIRLVSQEIEGRSPKVGRTFAALIALTKTKVTHKPMKPFELWCGQS